MQSAKASLKIGDVVGGYLLMEKFNGNLKKEFWRGQALRGGQQVFLKLLPIDADGFGAWRRAEEEGSAIQERIAKCDPRVPCVIEAPFMTDTHLVLVQEFVAGEDLRQIVARHPLSPNEALRIAMELLDSVRKWRELHPNFSHNDLTLDNIRVGPGGQVRIVDFGIASLGQAAQGRQKFRTLLYATPERLKSGVCDTHTDPWGIAATIYMACSQLKPPYAIERNMLIFNVAPQRLPSPFGGLSAILSKQLSMEPSRRYSSPEGFRADLDALAHSRTTLAEREALHEPTTTAPEPPPVTELVDDPDVKPAPRGFHLTGRLAWLAAALAAGLLFATTPTKPAAPVTRTLDEEITSLEKDWDSDSHTWIPIVKLAFHGDDTARTKAAARKMLDDYRGDYPHVSQRMWERAGAILNRISTPDAEARFETLMVQGHIERLRNHAPTAIQNFEKAAKLDPRSPDPHIALSRMYVNDFRKLQAQIERAAATGHPPGKREKAEMGDALALEARKYRRPSAPAAQQRLDLLTRASNYYAQAIGYGKSDERKQQTVLEILKCQQYLNNARR